MVLEQLSEWFAISSQDLPLLMQLSFPTWDGILLHPPALG